MRNKLFVLSLLLSLLNCGQGGYSGYIPDDEEEEEEYMDEEGNDEEEYTDEEENDDEEEYTDEEENDDEEEYRGGDVRVKVEYNTYNNRNVFRDDSIFKDINKGKSKGNTNNIDSINIDSIR